MTPRLGIVKAGLRRTTEALACELATPGASTPSWNDLEWRLARAVAVAHGVAPLLSQALRWSGPAGWSPFLQAQREHVEQRHRRIAALLDLIDARATKSGIAIVPLKGAALHALGVYAAGERPMADIDLLVAEADVERTAQLLHGLGYYEAFVTWRHHVYKPRIGKPYAQLGEHRDNPINVEVHTRVQERLPVAAVDITAQVFPPAPHTGLNAYPSQAALMAHLLLHAAGNIRGRGLKLLQLHDIARLSRRMTAQDWAMLVEMPAGLWWALPPMLLVSRYCAADCIPADVVERAMAQCPWWLAAHSKEATLTGISSSAVWIEAFPGIEWCRSPREALDYVLLRLKPSPEMLRERKDLARTQTWATSLSWASMPQWRRVLRWALSPRARVDTMFVVGAALES